MSTKKIDIAVAIAAVTLVVGGTVATTCTLTGKCTWLTKSVTADGAATAELLTFVKAGDESGLRAWLVKRGPEAAHRAVLGLDNTNDLSGRARLFVLNVVHSLGSEGLSDEAVKSWAVALRSLANTILHPGSDRADYLARGYLMEGRVAEAAAEYAQYPTSPAAAVFFGHYPDLRAPASAKTR